MKRTDAILRSVQLISHGPTLLGSSRSPLASLFFSRVLPRLRTRFSHINTGRTGSSFPITGRSPWLARSETRTDDDGEHAIVEGSWTMPLPRSRRSSGSDSSIRSCSTSRQARTLLSSWTGASAGEAMWLKHYVSGRGAWAWEGLSSMLRWVEPSSRSLISQED